MRKPISGATTAIAAMAVALAIPAGADVDSAAGSEAFAVAAQQEASIPEGGAASSPNGYFASAFRIGPVGGPYRYFMLAPQRATLGALSHPSSDQLLQAETVLDR